MAWVEKRVSRTPREVKTTKEEYEKIFRKEKERRENCGRGGGSRKGVIIRYIMGSTI